MKTRELGEYLVAAGSAAFRLGESDCATFMADWLMRCGLPDVMADLRGSYSSVAEFSRFVVRGGGMLAICRQRFVAAGLQETITPRAGDVAVLELRRFGTRERWGMVGAIALSERTFAIRGSGRIVMTSRARVAKIWTVDA